MNGRRLTLSRLLKMLVLYIAAGAITTVAVAWAIVFLDRDELQFTSTTRGGWIALPDGLAMISISERRAAGSRLSDIFIWSWVADDSPAEALARDERYRPAARLPFRSCRSNVIRALSARFQQAEVRMAIEARGWPLPALWCAPFVATSAGVERNDPVLCGIALGETSGTTNNITTLNDRASTLPMMPVWSGFAIDAGVFSVGWFFAIALLTAARRSVRTLRGRCSRCGYRLDNASAGCSECGDGRED